MDLEVGQQVGDGWEIIGFGKWGANNSVSYVAARHSCGAERKYARSKIIKEKPPCKKCTAFVSRRFEALPIALNKEYRSYSYSARQRGYGFFLTKEHFNRLVQDNCFYCDSPPSSKKTITAKRKGNWHEDVYLNGIDRVNNSIGYEENNVVTACSRCNYAKRDLSIEEWIEQVKKWSDRLDALKFSVKLGMEY